MERKLRNTISKREVTNLVNKFIKVVESIKKYLYNYI